MSRSQDDWTIIISPTYAQGSHVASQLASEEGQSPLAYEWVPSCTALRKIEGARPDRIVIHNYLQWGPGTADLWWAICRLDVMIGIEVVWW